MVSVAELRTHAREIFAAGVKAADPFDAILRHVRRSGDCLEIADVRYSLSKIGRVFAVGAGKAAARMARAIEDLLGDRISDGRVVVKYGHGLPLEKIKVTEAGHPIPDAAGAAGARQIMNIVQDAGQDELILFLISGGGSALLPAPAEGVTLAEKQRMTEMFLESGATIDEINAVRKHISKIKGGRLAKMAAPAKLAALILSDVVGDSLETIASGPTVGDPTTYADCLEIIHRHGLWDRTPRAVRQALQRGAKGEIEETPKPGDPLFGRVQNVIVGNNRLALEAGRRQAEALGYHTVILSDRLAGESRAVAVSHAAVVKRIAQANEPLPRPACVISGGETTVTLRGDGLGGRNQEFALAAALEIEGLEGAVVLSAGSDGTDGPTDAAGAIVDGSTVRRGRARGLDAAQFLARNDSYPFLQATGDLLITGPTLTNVMDLQVMLVA
ncbi:MAG TPA: glycerate kinase [Candidatus Binatia bacterium]|nr:glycerate kinase [Candidatus Binatia bacterium]